MYTCFNNSSYSLTTQARMDNPDEPIVSGACMHCARVREGLYAVRHSFRGATHSFQILVCLPDMYALNRENISDVKIYFTFCELGV